MHVSASPTAPLGTPTKDIASRIATIDAMRGLVMVIMMMDHVRERVYLHKQVSDPMNVEDTSPELFFSRLAAHLCAPVFVFLTGLSAWLYSHPSSATFRSPTGFLFKRGLFLIALEVTVVSFSWMGEYHTIWLQVIWAIGLSMIALSLMVKLPYWLIGVIGFLIVFGHNLLTPISFAQGELGYTLWAILHDRNIIVSDWVIRVKVSYPVLPWIGVIALGYVAGPLYSSIKSGLRRKTLIALGVSCWGLLSILRGFNLYGETLPWTIHDTAVKSIMSFLNFTKYPPSLDFLLATLGSAFLLMAWFDSLNNAFIRIMKNFGAAPMFFYILHLYTLLILYWILIAIFGANQGSLYGVNQFWWVWVMSALLTFLLYFPTKAFAAYKQRSKSTILRYL